MTSDHGIAHFPFSRHRSKMHANFLGSRGFNCLDMYNLYTSQSINQATNQRTITESSIFAVKLLVVAGAPWCLLFFHLANTPGQDPHKSSWGRAGCTNRNELIVLRCPTLSINTITGGLSLRVCGALAQLDLNQRPAKTCQQQWPYGRNRGNWAISRGRVFRQRTVRRANFYRVL